MHSFLMLMTAYFGFFAILCVAEHARNKREIDFSVYGDGGNGKNDRSDSKPIHIKWIPNNDSKGFEDQGDLKGDWSKCNADIHKMVERTEGAYRSESETNYEALALKLYERLNGWSPGVWVTLAMSQHDSINMWVHRNLSFSPISDNTCIFNNDKYFIMAMKIK